MLFALLQPASLAGLLLGFAFAMILRGTVQRMVIARQGGPRSSGHALDPKHDFDIFGIVAAVLGGTGWGRRAPTAFGERRGRFAVLIAGPVAVLVASQVAFAFAAFTVGVPPDWAALGTSNVLKGMPAAPATELVVSFAVALLAAGLLALVPLPPLDGWGLLVLRAGVRPSQGFARAQHWLDEQNIGVVVLLIGIVLPIGAGAPPFLLFIIDVITHPILVAWASV